MPAQLMIADRGQTHVVRCAEIEWLEAAENYDNIHLAGKSLLMRRTLAAVLNDPGGNICSHAPWVPPWRCLLCSWSGRGEKAMRRSFCAVASKCRAAGN